jgi:hypothetical protein
MNLPPAAIATQTKAQHHPLECAMQTARSKKGICRAWLDGGGMAETYTEARTYDNTLNHRPRG